MISAMMRFNILLLLSIACSTVGFTQTAKIEYIAHAAFVLESEQGTRVLIDPYHSYNQMGYTFPDNIDVDFVLITHPHFDHDASKYVGANTPVFREAGTYQFKDINFYGIGSNHAFYKQIAARGSQAYNTIWVVEIGGKRIAHLGDNAVPTPEEVEKLATVDFIIGHPNDAVLALFPDKTYIPNHYLLPEITKHTNWMQAVDDWLEDKTNVTRLPSNVYQLSQPNPKGIVVFQPSAAVKEWSPEYYQTLDLIKTALARFRETSDKPEENKDMAAILSLMDKAIETAPYVFDGYLNKATLLSGQKQYAPLITTLEKGFACVPDIDWGREARAHQLLAEAYVAVDRKKDAYNHYLWIVRHERIVNKNALEAAMTFIKDFRPK